MTRANGQNSRSERSEFKSPPTDGSGMVDLHTAPNRVFCLAPTQPWQFKILAVIANGCEK
jgi:hypothetical protein